MPVLINDFALHVREDFDVCQCGRHVRVIVSLTRHAQRPDVPPAAEDAERRLSSGTAVHGNLTHLISAATSSAFLGGPHMPCR